MPNHVTNRIYCENAFRERIVEKLVSVDKEGKKYVDFNNLIQTPKYIYQGDFGEEERKKYGKNNWYDWNIENWGTKWNAYETEITEDYIQFRSAWNPPIPVLKKLSSLFPETKIVILMHDEGFFDNFGIIFENGKKVVHEKINSTQVLSYMLQGWLDYESLKEIIEGDEDCE